MSTEAISTIQNQVPRYEPSRNEPSESRLRADAESASAANLSGDDTEGTAIVVAEDEAIISNEAKALAEAESTTEEDELKSEQEKEQEEEDQDQLTEEDLLQIKKLQSRDLEVRTHETAHLRTAGSYARGGANFDLQRGPDGKQYAVGGHVNIDVSEVSNDPQATITKAQTIKRAALAPASPSGKDRQVAAQAESLIAKSQKALAEERLAGPDESEKPEEPQEPTETSTRTPEVGTASEDADLFQGFKPLELTVGSEQSDEQQEQRSSFGVSAYTRQADTSNGSLVGGGISLIA